MTFGGASARIALVGCRVDTSNEESVKRSKIIADAIKPRNDILYPDKKRSYSYKLSMVSHKVKTKAFRLYVAVKP